MRRFSIRSAAALLALAGCAVLAWQVHSLHGRLDRLDAENAALRKSDEEWIRLKSEVAAAQSLQSQQAEIEQLREENKDLLRLRNEIRELRLKQEQAESLKAANARLLQVLQNSQLNSNLQSAVADARRQGALLGIAIRPANDPRNPAAGSSPFNGAAVTWIDPNAPIAAAGVRVGDIIVRVDGRTIENPEQLQSEMLARKPGDFVTLDVIRGNDPVRLQVRTIPWKQ
ncbi:MAG: PDZ domain-containing protein [Verrucomicrobiota bacterium]